MLIRLGGGVGGAGLKNYLETGEKIGREHTRDELDKRIILEGDLGETARIIDDDMHTTTPDAERFLHLTFGFKEDNISQEMYAAINEDIKEFLIGGYQPGEMTYYAEAHAPKIKSEPDAKGNPVERRGHIHVIIPKHNNITGGKEDPLGMMSARFGGKRTTQDYIDAFQEHINHKYGLSSPKDEDSRRVDFTSKADVLSRIDGHDFTGKNREWQQTIRDRMISEKIETPEAFQAMLKTVGKVSIGKKGQPDQYLQVCPHGETKNVRLKDWQFTNEFITKTTADKEAFVHQERVKRYRETNPGRPTPEHVAEVLTDWRQHQDAIRFMHTGSAQYKNEFKSGSQEERAQILADKKEKFYAKAEREFGFDAKEATPAELDAQATYEAALAAAFPNRRLNASHCRSIDQVRTAIAAGDAIVADPEQALKDLTFSQSTATERDLERFLLKNTADRDQYEAAMAAILAAPGLVVRQDEKGNPTFTTEGIVKTEKDLVACVERMAAVGRPPSRAEIDAYLASPEYKAEENARNATAATFPARFASVAKAFTQAAFAPHGDIHDMPAMDEIRSIDEIPSVHETKFEQVSNEVLSSKSMNEGQVEAYKLLVSERQLCVVNGAAGTGKSYILAAMRETYERTGHTVYGAILQGKTAEDLERDSGIQSVTMHSFLDKLNKGTLELDNKSVVVVDEAGMIGSGQMENLLRHIEKSGAKIRLVGDVKQLAAVEYGRAFKEVSTRCEVASLTEIMRQGSHVRHDPEKYAEFQWQRDASMQLAEHEIAAPLAAYAANGNIHFAENAKAAQAEIVEKWAAYRTADPSQSLIVLVHTNVERKALNALMRDEIKKTGGLSDEIDVTTTEGKLKMAVGESVMFTKANRELGVKNGTSGVIESIKDGHLTIRLDNGLVAIIPAKPSGDAHAITYGYASTVHKSQGMTKDRALILANESMSLENTYVGMSRHRISLDIIADKSVFNDLDGLTAKLDKSGRKDFSHDAAKPEWETVRENDNVVAEYKSAFAHDQVIARAAKDAKFTEMRDNLDARQLLDRVAKSHGVDVSIYGITKDKAGHDRIECGKRQLNVSDFLTKELHLDYKTEAAPAMREVYAAQLEKTYAPHRDGKAAQALPAHAVDKPMWREFQTYRAARAEEYKKASTALQSDHTDRKAAIAKTAQAGKLRAQHTVDSYAGKRAEIKEIRATAAEATKALSKENSDRLGDLMQEFKKPQAAEYKDFLATKAAGSEKHLDELRRVSLTKTDQERVKGIETAREASSQKGMHAAEQALIEADARAAETARLASLATDHAKEQAEKAAADKAAELEKAESEKAAKIVKAAEAERLTEPAQRADIRKQIEGLTGNSKPVVMASEASHANSEGRIVSGNNLYVAVVTGPTVEIFERAKLEKNMEYNGTAEGRDIFAPGNKISIRNGAAKVMEKREHKIPDHVKAIEAARERGHGLG